MDNRNLSKANTLRIFCIKAKKFKFKKNNCSKENKESFCFLKEKDFQLKFFKIIIELIQEINFGLLLAILELMKLKGMIEI